MVLEIDIVGIHPEDDAEQWNQTWPEMGEDATLEERKEIAYRAVKGGKKITVFYSVTFPPFQEVVDRLKTANQTLLDLFSSQYEVWIGYHAILQESRRTMAPEGVEQDSLEKLLDAERAVVARMQVKQAIQVAELMRKAVEGQQAEYQRAQPVDASAPHFCPAPVQGTAPCSSPRPRWPRSCCWVPPLASGKRGERPGRKARRSRSAIRPSVIGRMPRSSATRQAIITLPSPSVGQPGSGGGERSPWGCASRHLLIWRVFRTDTARVCLALCVSLAVGSLAMWCG
jgi:hypothetical protein